MAIKITDPKIRVTMINDKVRMYLLPPLFNAAVREMRKHTGWYLKGMPGAAAMRREINQITDAQELKYKLRRIR